MTTVAYTAGVMAADTLMSRGSEVCSGARKIFATEHYLVGFSGWYGLVPAFVHFIQQNEGSTDGDAECFHRVWENAPDNKEECSIILVNKRGAIFYAGSSPPVLVPRKFEAVGTGAGYALGAMASGAGAKKAVKIAAGLDAYTGGDFIHLSLKDIGK